MKDAEKLLYDAKIGIVKRIIERWPGIPLNDDGAEELAYLVDLPEEQVAEIVTPIYREHKRKINEPFYNALLDKCPVYELVLAYPGKMYSMHAYMQGYYEEIIKHLLMIGTEELAPEMAEKMADDILYEKEYEEIPDFIWAFMTEEYIDFLRTYYKKNNEWCNKINKQIAKSKKKKILYRD